MGKVMASIFCYIQGNILVEFQTICADFKKVIVINLKCSAKEQYQSVPIIISFVPPLVVIKTLLFALHKAERTNCAL
jgi:hypothetical protein